MFKFFTCFLLYILFTFNTFASTFKVNEILVSGNNKIETLTILENLSFQKSQVIDSEELNNSLKQLYKTGYFADIRISEEKNNVLINVLENPMINEIYFIGDLKISKEEAKKQLSCKSRTPYSKTKVKKDLDGLYGLYQKTGYIDVKIEPRVIFLKENRVDIIFEIEEGRANYISDIIFTGNEAFSDFTLNSLLTIKPYNRLDVISTLMGKNKFEEDKIELEKKTIQKWYFDNGYVNFNFLSSSAAINEQDSKILINFFLDEGEQYKFGKINVNNPLQNIPTIEFEKAISSDVKSGKVYNQSATEASLLQLNEVLSTNGFGNANTEYTQKINEADKTVDITFTTRALKDLYIRKINISGNISTLEQVILREMVIAEGDVYDPKKVALSKDRLYMLGYFKRVDFKENMSDDNAFVDIEIDLEEQFYGSVNASVGYSNLEGLIGMFQFQINNLFGRGYSIGLNAYRSGFSERYGVNFYNPYFFANKNIGLGFDVFYSGYGRLGGLGVNSMLMNYPIEGQSIGFNTTLGFEIMNRLTYSVGFGYMFTTSSILNDAIGKIYGSIMGERQAITLNHSITWNQLNRARYSTSGYSISYSEKYAGFGFMGDQHFINRSAMFVGYLPFLRENLIFHTAFEAGFVQNLGSNFIGMENLYSLGYYKMRGFSFFGLGPRIIYTNDTTGAVRTFNYAIQGQYYYYGTVELRSPLFIPKDYGIMFVAFMDYGSVWDASTPLSSYKYIDSNNSANNYTESVYDDNITRVSVGGGILWQSAMGEIGFYFARAIVAGKYDSLMPFNIKLGTHF